MNDKPKLTLLSADSAQDLQVLIALFKKLTGRDPTQKEIEETKAELSIMQDSNN